MEHAVNKKKIHTYTYIHIYIHTKTPASWNILAYISTCLIMYEYQKQLNATLQVTKQIKDNFFQQQMVSVVSVT